MRATKQRSEIADLLTSVSGFLTAQEIHAALQARGSTIGLATVYRNLAALADRGEVDTVAGIGGEMRYRSCSASHHHHLTCRACGRTLEIAVDEFEAVFEGIARRHGFRDVRHTIEIIGTCKHCSK